MREGCACKKDSSVTLIKLGNQMVGLVGLIPLFEEWLSRGKSAETLGKEEILTSIRKKNYVSAKVEEEYVKAIKAAYAAYRTGHTVG